MGKIPKPRREGQSGGMNHTSSGRKTVKRGGDANRAGGKQGGGWFSCLLFIPVIGGALGLAVGLTASLAIRLLA